MGKINNINRQTGVLTIEFALGSFALFLVLFAVFEIGRFAYIVNLTDATLSESTRKVRIFEGEKLETSYKKRLEDVFTDNDSFWNQISMVTADDFSFEIESYDSLLSMSEGSQVSNCERCPIIVYELNYDYSPVLFPEVLMSVGISRRILTVQEHEGGRTRMHSSQKGAFTVEAVFG